MNIDLPEAIQHYPEADSFDFRRSWEAIKITILGHTRLIAFVSLSAVAVVLVYIVAWPPIYQADVVVIAQSPDDRQRAEFYNQWNLFRVDDLSDEAELMTTPSLLSDVVDELDLSYQDVYHPFLSHAAYLWGESWVGKTYRKIKYFFFPRPVGPYTLTEEEVDRARTVHDFKAGVGIVPTPDTNMGRLAVRGPSPRVAEIANTLIDTYLQDRQTRFIDEAQTAYDSLEAEAEKARRELASSEADLERYYTENTMLLAYEKDRVEVSQWLEMRATVVDSESILASMEHTLSEVDRQLGTESSEVVASRVYAKNSIRESLEANRSQLEIALAQTRLRYRPDSPEVRDIERQIEAIEGMIQAEDERQELQRSLTLSETYESLRQRRSQLLGEIEGIRASIEVKQSALAELEDHVRAIPERVSVSQSLQRERDLRQKKYLGLQDKLMIAAVSLATIRSAPPALRVVEYAVPPDKPYWPKTKLFLLVALILGAIGGTVLSLILDVVAGPVSRYRVSAERFGDVYAIVRQDSEYLARLYSLPNRAEKRLLAKIGTRP